MTEQYDGGSGDGSRPTKIITPTYLDTLLANDHTTPANLEKWARDEDTYSARSSREDGGMRRDVSNFYGAIAVSSKDTMSTLKESEDVHKTIIYRLKERDAGMIGRIGYRLLDLLDESGISSNYKRYSIGELLDKQVMLMRKATNGMEVPIRMAKGQWKKLSEYKTASRRKKGSIALEQSEAIQQNDAYRAALKFAKETFDYVANDEEKLKIHEHMDEIADRIPQLESRIGLLSHIYGLKDNHLMLVDKLQEGLGNTIQVHETMRATAVESMELLHEIAPIIQIEYEMVDFTKDIMGRLELWSDVLQGVSQANSLAMQYAMGVSGKIRDRSFDISSVPLDDAMSILVEEQRKMNETDLREKNSRDLNDLSRFDKFL